jgi:hypothetical protein
MADNFNIAKFLKENSLGSYGILGKYVDLHALKEQDETVSEGLFSITLDTATNLNTIKKYADLKKISVIVVDPEGPGGGFPMVEYTGSKEALEGFIDTFFKQDADYIKSQIMPVDGNMNEEDGYGNNRPTQEVPYEDSEDRLDGFGSEFDQVDSVTEVDGEDENLWMKDVDGTDAYKVGNWACYYYYPGVLVWEIDTSDELEVSATPNSEDDGTTPIRIDIDEKTQYQMTLKQSEFADFNEYATAMKPYLNRIEDLESNWGSLAPSENLAELEKLENIYASSEMDNQNRMLGLIDTDLEAKLPLFRSAVKSARDKGLSDMAIFKMLSTNSMTKSSVDSLIADGLAPEDVVDFFATDFTSDDDLEYDDAESFDYGYRPGPNDPIGPNEVDEEVTVSSSGVEMGGLSEDIDIWQMAGDHLEAFRNELASAHAMASQSGQREWVGALNKIALRLDALEGAMAEANAKLGVLPIK